MTRALPSVSTVTECDSCGHRLPGDRRVTQASRLPSTVVAVGPSTDATSAVVIRIWRERGVTGLRGRITVLADDPADDDLVTKVTGAAEILGTVRRWLEGFPRDI